MPESVFEFPCRKYLDAMANKNAKTGFLNLMCYIYLINLDILLPVGEGLLQHKIQVTMLPYNTKYRKRTYLHTSTVQNRIQNKINVNEWETKFPF